MVRAKLDIRYKPELTAYGWYLAIVERYGFNCDWEIRSIGHRYASSDSARAGGGRAAKRLGIEIVKEKP